MLLAAAAAATTANTLTGRLAQTIPGHRAQGPSASTPTRRKAAPDTDGETQTRSHWQATQNLNLDWHATERSSWRLQPPALAHPT